MYFIQTAILVAMVGFHALAASAQESNQATTPDERFKKLSKDFNSDAYAFRQATTEADRNSIVDSAHKITQQMFDLADKNSGEPVALDALVQVINQELWLENNSTHPGFGNDNLQVRAIAILQREYITSDKIAEATRRVQYGFRPECEAFLRAVVEQNPNREIQGLASLRLAQCLTARLQKVLLLQLRPEMVTRYEGLFGKEYVDAVMHQDRAEANAEIEALFENSAKKSGDVDLPYGDTVGKRAESELYELRNLVVGKVAPEINGEDQDGTRFKLSDYRGKVVLLYFWSEY